MAEKPYDQYVASVRPENNGKSVLILTANNTQDLEFFYPYYRFVEEGYRVDVATPKGGEFKAEHDMGLKETKAVKDISANQYDLLYIPGGKAPAELKKNDDVLELVKNFAQTKKPIAAICHGPQVLAAADLIQGRTIAAWPEVEKEIKQAGGNYANEPTIVDGQFITGRWPGDLPSHVACTLRILEGTQSNDTMAGSRRFATGKS